MTLAKLQRVLMALSQQTGNVPHGWIGASTGGELEIQFTGQLTGLQHAYMRRVGFVSLPDEPWSRYVYRPIKRARK